MKTRLVAATPFLAGLAGLVALAWWFHGFARPAPVPERPLGTEQFHGIKVQAARPAGSGGTSFARTDAPVETAPGLWPWFRGPAFDGVAPDGIRLARNWGPEGPPALWSVQMGEGYAGPVVRNGRVYVLDYDQAGQADAIRCFALTNGEELWRRSYPVVVKRNHGMSRTVPAVTDKHVVTLGPKCHLTCTDALTGAIVWQHDLVAEFGVTVPEWYAGQCPLIDGERVIVGTGGQALIMAFDLATGKVAWKTPNPRNWVMTHSSVLRIEHAGKPQYVWCGSGGVASVAAGDGALLWENLEWVINTATVPTPVRIGKDRLLLSGGYDSGAMILRLPASAGAAPTVVARLKPREFGSDQQTPVFYKGHIFGVKPGGQMTCLDPNGKALWSSGSDRFGLGPYIAADGVIVALNDSGRLSLIEATPAAYKPIAQAKVLEGPEAWGPLALAGTRLLARDLTRMVCLDVGAK